MSVELQQVGLVTIGRNEGERLERCIRSVPPGVAPVVYVDSGSTDGSVEFARRHGVDVVDLDMSRPFTAARARNAGLQRLEARAPDVKFVQFIDGDCEMAPDWLATALREIEASSDLAVVFGHRREENPQASVYNMLCDMEWRWDLPLGDVKSCGGDALMRLSALRGVGGYNEALIAGEEPELCFRLRERGWRIRHIDAPMTIHDARISEFSQWWKRAVRSGHAYAELSDLHGRSEERFMVDAVRSIARWSIGVPGLAVGLALPTLGLSLGLAGGYAVLFDRVRRAQIEKGVPERDAATYALYCVLGKFPQMTGVTKYWLNKLKGTRSALIEYKHSK